MNKPDFQPIELGGVPDLHSTAALRIQQLALAEFKKSTRRRARVRAVLFAAIAVGSAMYLLIAAQRMQQLFG